MSACHFVPLSKYDWSLHPALVAIALPWNPTAYCLIASFCAVSLWMTVELTLQVMFTFRRHKGLYFWSLLVCTWGVALHVVGVILKLFNESNWIVSSIIFKIGWVGNVTGFSLVLYSRLNLVVHDRRIRRAVLAMIITDAFLLHTPIIIFDFGISSPHPNIWYMPMKVMERIQVVWFSVQETVISLMYIWCTRDFLKDIYSHQTHRVMQLLICAQIIAIIFDVVLITVDCNNMFTLKVVIHPFCYAVKLKIEFIVLNQLLALIKHGIAPSSFPAPDEESPDASGPTPPRSGARVDFKHGSFVSTDITATDARDSAAADAASRKESVLLPSGGLGRDMEYYRRRHRTGTADNENGDSGVAGDTPNNNNRTDSTTPQPPANPDPDAIEPVPLPGSPHTPSPPSPPPPNTTTAGTSTPRAPGSSSRRSFEPQLPARSFSDPTPLGPAQREQDSEAIVAQIERHYLGNWNGHSTR
ncbi:uncharacterized protein Z520_08309 [Fonsecaea multimorphosa CBS 102226]|uniref:DUF7703 domain-containing protein n=1 Tax=Fonsecaea multimorphosa CBS 102226 TaxID=1442371 RepID=A0A0D2JZM2_9EURO|nr:uncharacterized protein Z520_08309 [Fonsecaea multimorphosa CBS 102226]KIX96054.1 hypothetical protein Z520_08309 [Fonsecaea multimorphosa CBS 102226]OAL21820.1 hypothetical protein AYO22_07762 [Fonsecaea multimorphosa]